ncbi:mannose-1-phosphate guanylyltransferase [bacterium]|nr:mannose-1-phosphate guanylyltransferase [bacterium]MBU1985433.1 mannose-1-phosphate guanylyltransferase [bacterium]
MLHSVIMAGGVGARFWPISRRQRPKQLLDLLGEGSLIEQTLSRIEPLVAPERRWIVTSPSQAGLIHEMVPSLSASRFILEPMGKNTAPAIGLSAVHLLRQDPDAVMLVLPADHRISEVEKFRECLMTAVEMVSNSDRLATLGIEPTRPETGYGYIQIDRAAGAISSGVWRVKTFAEKPNPTAAKLFLESGEFLWNSGIFVWRADVILRQLAEHQPKWYSGLQEIAGVIGTPDEEEMARHVFAALKGISIDYAVMEHAPQVIVVQGTFGWSDVGSWDEIWRLLQQDKDGNASRGTARLVQSKNNLVLARERLIALVGVEDMIVVDAGDAILICPRSESQRVRALVDELEKSSEDSYL